MPDFKYPASIYDQPESLLSFLGSYWQYSYQGSDLLQATLAARTQLDAQAHLNLLELVASVSRFKVPLFHTENWFFLTFNESELNTEAVLPKFQNNTEHVFEADSTLQYATVPQTVTNYSIVVPAELSNVKVILNRITESSLTLAAGVDFYIADGVLTFRSNPFSNPATPVREVFENNVSIDRQAGLWLFRGSWDWQNVYEQFGYALGLKLQSSEGYKDLVVAILDALVEGTSIRHAESAWSAITGVPLVRDAVETIEQVTDTRQHTVVVSDKHVYKFKLGSTVIVTVGQQVHAGDPLVDTLQFYEFNRGLLSDDLRALVLGSGVLAAGYLGDLVFDNKEVTPTLEYDDAGYAKLSFEINGFPADVEKFWNDVHLKGLAAGKTLAHYLDQRAVPVGEPTAASLPTTINPLRFLVQNILRYHAHVVRVKPKYLGDLKLGLATATHLRRIIPPHTLMLVIVELEHTDETIIMSAPGTTTSPGYVEAVSGFPCMIATDELSPDMITETVRIKQLTGKCE